MPKPPSRTPKSNENKPSAQNGTHGPSAVVSGYEEAQADEVEALRAIYMDDYTEIKSKAAWSKATEKSFKLTLHAFSDDTIYVDLFVTLTATYPRTLPVLHLGEAVNVSKPTLDKIHELVATIPRSLLGEVMIHEIATSIQEVLEDAGTALAQKEAEKALLPSLEEERAVSEAASLKQAQELEQALKKQKSQAQEEEERELQRRIDEQDRKRNAAKLKREQDLASTGEKSPSSKLKYVLFDREVTFRDDDGRETNFQAVSILDTLRTGLQYSVLRAASATDAPVVMVLKRLQVTDLRAKRSILDLEALLEKLRGVRHGNLINMLDFKVEHEREMWQFDILIESSNEGTLADLIDIAGTLPAPKARLFGIEMLQAIDYLHKNGVVHGRIQPGNVFLHHSYNGSRTVKISDAGYQNLLQSLVSHTSSSTSATVPARWSAPELSSEGAAKSRKSDIWDFGTVLTQMLLGLNVCEKYPTPAALINAMQLSDPLEDLLRDLFRSDPRVRPNAFDVTPYEFFRVDAPILPLGNNSNGRERSSTVNSLPNKPRPESTSGLPASASRYLTEWDEIGRLGKGGYGEVVKARNKLDGRIYAIKKITNKTPAELSQVLSEVYLLATLNHPYVVRYYTAWPEDDATSKEDASEEFTSSSSAAFLGVGNGRSSPSFGQSTGGLDFISSSGYPKIEFGYDDDDDEDAVSDGNDDDDESESSSDKDSPIAGKANKSALTKVRSYSRPTTRSTLYIQMEYCERLTLRDIIRKDISKRPEEVWRLFRQILEGLAHIHSHGIIHRDLKPENIFIDSSDDARIGDFGLATSGHFSRVDRVTSNQTADTEMTQNVGTTFYVAPELQARGPSNYTDKIDMYSLGIIFFEMCHHISTGMERMHELTALRQKDPVLPADLRTPSKALQCEIIESLLSHRPSVRPTSAELLRSGKVPVQIEDETVRLALQGLADEDSPYHHKMMSALFSNPPERSIRTQMWDLSDKEATQVPSVEFSLIQSAVRDRMTKVFRRHGGVEISRQGLLPRSCYYENKNAFQLLDASGTLVQLPYDLTLPFARMIARGAKVAEKNFTFGVVFRDPLTNGAPRSNREADFDIVSHDSRDLALKEAEIIKVMDELIDEFPTLLAAPMCFHVSHAKLLELIMDFCRIETRQRPAVQEILGKLNIQEWTWSKIKTELRNVSVGVSSTSLDELARFDFRDTPDKTLVKLQGIFAGTQYISRLHDVFTHMTGFIEYCKRLEVKRKIYVCPFSSVNNQFYHGGITYQCLFDKRKRAVLAAGGRYDTLVSAHQPRQTGTEKQSTLHAVGINIAIDTVVTSMVRYQSSSTSANAFLKSAENSSEHRWPIRRCDVLVAGFEPQTTRSTGVRLLAELWACDISSELAADTSSPEELSAQHRNDNYSWIVTIRHDSHASGRPDLKVKCVDKGEDVDVRSSDLISFLQTEIRERDQREGVHERARLTRQHSHTGSADKAEVHVLVSNHKTKKSNKMRIVESARAAALELLTSSSGAPIAAIETGSDTFEKIRQTRLSDPESWRRAIQDVQLTERAYLGEVREEIENLKARYGDEHKTCFVYNFRTGACINYDMRS